MTKILQAIAIAFGVLALALFSSILDGALVGFIVGLFAALVALLFGGDPASVGQTAAFICGGLWCAGHFCVKLGQFHEKVSEKQTARKIREALREDSQ